MNSKHYVGKQVSSFERYDDITVTGVALLVDDENEYRAGDDSGYVLEVSCPYGTQAMAEHILASVRGKPYRGFRAENAPLSPVAELGDAVTVNGVHSLLAHHNVQFGSGHMAEIAAPGESTLEHEYQWASPERREFNRKIADTRSMITKTAEEIRLEVFGEDGAFTALSQTVDSIVLEIRGSEDEDGLSDRVSLIEQSLDNITLSVSNSETSSSITLKIGEMEFTSPAIQMSGVVTFAGLKDGTTTIDGGCIKTGTIDADRLNLTGQITFGDLDEELRSDIENAGGISEQQAKTLITDTLVQSPTIKGGLFYDLQGIGQLDLSLEAYGDSLPSLLFTDTKNNVDLFAVYPLNIYSTWAGLTMLDAPVLSVEKWEGEDANHILLYGTWNFRPTELVDFSEANVDFGGQSAEDLGITVDVADAVDAALEDFTVSSVGSGDSSLSFPGGDAYLSGDDYVVLQIAGTSYAYLDDTAFTCYPTRSIDLGKTGAPWSNLYADSCECCTSDANKKNSIEDLPDKYVAMFDLLRPIRYKLNNGTSGRYHVGYIAQEVEAAMTAVGINSTEFGGFIRDEDEDGNEVLMLRYGEFDAIRDLKIKQLEARVAALEEA
jgi:hypothetical protein